MQPKFIHLPEMKMVGLGTKFISAQSPDKNNMKKIPELWGQFMAQNRGSLVEPVTHPTVWWKACRRARVNHIPMKCSTSPVRR
jgi:predicted transcriptional regulator YdeE